MKNIDRILFSSSITIFLVILLSTLLGVFVGAIILTFVEIEDYAEIQTIPEPTTQQAKLDAKAILAEVNRVRAENGCTQPLVVNEQLTIAAQERADFIAKGNWTHDGYETTVRKHYKYKHLGENLAKNYQSEKLVVQAWMDSKTHREVMLNCIYVETGIGINGLHIAHEYGKR